MLQRAAEFGRCRVQDVQLLHQFGCNYMQGFLIARPMPFADALTWMSRMRRLDTVLNDVSLSPLVARVSKLVELP